MVKYKVIFQIKEIQLERKKNMDMELSLCQKEKSELELKVEQLEKLVRDDAEN